VNGGPPHRNPLNPVQYLILYLYNTSYFSENMLNLIHSNVELQTILDVAYRKFLCDTARPTLCLLLCYTAFECCPQTYPNIKFLLPILTTFPVTTASAERSFSMLRRLKTWLRSSMCEDCLTGLALLTLATDIEVKPEEVVERFLKRSRRII